MKTEIKINSRLEALHIIKRLKTYEISYIETETSIIADITPEKAWCVGLI